MKVSASAAPARPSHDVNSSMAKEPHSDNLQSDLQWLDDRVTRVDAASALARAILACPPDIREGLLETALEHQRAGPPVPPFTDLMADAAHWADLASQSELKAYMVVCFTRVSPAEQQAFLAMVQGRVAA